MSNNNLAVYTHTRLPTASYLADTFMLQLKVFSSGMHISWTSVSWLGAYEQETASANEDNLTAEQHLWSVQNQWLMNCKWNHCYSANNSTTPNSEYTMNTKKLMAVNIIANKIKLHFWLTLVAWHSGRTSVSDWRTFPVLRSTCSWWVTTNVGKLSATGQLARPTQPFILSGR